MKPTRKQILEFVESVGGLEKLQTALTTGAALLKTADEALTVRTAELAVAAEANEDLQTKLDEANTAIAEKDALLESNVAQRRSGKMFTKSVDESAKPSKHDPSKNSLTMRLINKSR